MTSHRYADIPEALAFVPGLPLRAAVIPHPSIPPLPRKNRVDIAPTRNNITQGESDSLQRLPTEIFSVWLR